MSDMTGVREFEEPVKSMETKKPSMLEFMGLAGRQLEGLIMIQRIQ
jgi:hypothetical protein